jgi:2-polyprenyl-3-methyl-5-hydroxy-6-metoxy-1,4-benzoquinol methylase
MKSPDNNVSDAILESTIPVKKLEIGYKKHFKIDVKKYFADLEHVEIYKCRETGYRFYYPFSISGDSDFYIHFQKFDWYYMPWKWEHEACLSLIKPENKILEVGCGQGSFLKKIYELKGAICVGLELNESATISRSSIKIENITIENYSSDNKEQFDIVCSFQVLEHISDVNSFIKSQIACLKKGGSFIISVPNNESFLLKSKNLFLNMPPHHMGLWGEESLRSLENYHDIKLTKILYEPLQSYHFDWYIQATTNKYFGRLPGKIIIKSMRICRLKNIIHKYLTRKANSIRGHSIMAVYEKK